MHRSLRAFLILLLAVPCAAPQSIEPERGESVFDRIHNLINRLGEKTEEVLAPYIGSLPTLGDEDWTGLQTHTRTEDVHSGTLRQNAIIDFASELHEAHVRIEAWENPIAQVSTEIIAGAESADAAAALADEVKIQIVESASGDRLEIRPRYPDTRTSGRTNLTAHFVIKVPATVSVRCQNGFGDTFIAGVGGDVALESKFGVVDLRDIGGKAQVRAWGDFDLRAQGLRQGGTFDLRNSIADFKNCAGELQVNSFMGSVSVSKLPTDAYVRLHGESGALTCVLPDGAKPDVDARALYGVIHSDLELERSMQGGLEIGKLSAAEPTHRVEMDAMFADVTVRRESGFVPDVMPSTAGRESTYNSKEHVFEVAENEQLRIDAIVGSVRLRGSDSDRLVVKVTRRVHVDSPQEVPMALEALAFRHERIEGVTRLITNVSRDVASLGVSSYRVDLDITCPRSVSVEVFADDGSTSVEQIQGAVRIEQEKGAIHVEGVHAPEDGSVDIVNGSGNVNVFDVTGALSVITSQGAVETRNVTGKQDIRTEGGNTLIESPLGEFTVRQQSGNVRVIPLGGIVGNGSIEATDGDISMHVMSSADVVYYVTYENGAVFPSIPLSGEIEGRGGSFTGRLNEGTYRIDLNAKNGNVYLD